MFHKRASILSVLTLLGLGFSSIAALGHPCPAVEAAEIQSPKMDHPDMQHEDMQHPDMQHQGMGHHMNLPDPAGQKCDPKFTYADGPLGPNHWGGICNSGAMQAPIDIQNAEKLPIPPLQFSYRRTDWSIVNDCNHYRLTVRFPANRWLTVGRKPYFLSELNFHAPGENAVHGKRPRMTIQLIHLSPESEFLIVEVPVIAGKENPVIKTLWEHIPEKGKENKMNGTKIDVSDLLPSDHSFYRFSGSLTIPLCNEVVQWYIMQNPIEMSENQIAEYAKYYHNTARPLQPLHDRPVAEPQ